MSYRIFILFFSIFLLSSPVHAATCTLHASGDADCNGSINLADYEQFRREYTQAVTTKEADFNNDGSINLADFEIWRKSFYPTGGATVTPTSGTVPTATPTPSQTASNCRPPYTASSAWNTRITQPQYDPQSQQYVSTLTGFFGSDPNQFTYPVYEVTQSTATKKITLSGVYSDVISETQLQKKSNVQISIPIVVGAKPSAGSDAQFIIINKDTGDEWGFWQVKTTADGSYTAVNGYHYNIRWSGVPPTGFGSRGAGVPYLAGLIRPCEIAQGHIDHALAFAYQNVSSQFVYPATKSDGTGGSPKMPEGAHLQLDPTITDQQIHSWGCTDACFVMAKALQQYGMYIIDFAGHPKIMAEYEGTAHWNGKIINETVSKIPLTSFKLLKLP